MKRILSMSLTLLLLVCSAAPVFAAGAQDTVNAYPIISINGRSKSNPIYNTAGENINNIDFETDEIVDAVKECLPYLAKALVSGNYQPWIDKVMEFYAPLYEDILPDKNGEITDGSGPANRSGFGKVNAGYNGYSDHFIYDWREDPYRSADLLNADIQALKQKTEKDKVSLVGRCYGGNVVAAYLDKYGHEDIDSVVFYCSAGLGAAGAGCCFSGHFDIDPQMLENYTAGTPLLDDPVLDELIRSTLSYVNSFYGFNSLTDCLNFFVKKLYPKIAPTLMLSSYARFSSMWAMVSEPYFEEAKRIIFAGAEEEYAGLIEKIDRYHTMQIGLTDMLRKYEEEGLAVAVVTKYNRVLAPVIERANLQSDDTVELVLASFGAACADYGKELSAAYLRDREEKYISSDHIIDASVCAFRDRTWFVKDIAHSTIPASIDKMIVAICKGGKNFTVDSDANYPQFLKYNAETKTISLLEDPPADNGSSSVFGGLRAFFEKMKNFFNAFIAFLKQLINEGK